jgi:hypothetical protein
MNYSQLCRWANLKLNVKKSLKQIATAYVVFIMISTRKHTQKAASELSGFAKSSFCKLLKKRNVAVVTLDELSKRQAKQFGKHIRFMADGKLPWKITIIIDATLQNRSSLHSENVKRFNHGKGFVIGHQWTNIVLFFNEMLIPLPPIAFYTKKYSRENNLEYRTENENVVEYIRNLDLEEYFGPHDPKQVIVLADSGYDSKDIENAIQIKQWRYVIALKKTRAVKTEKEYASTPKSKGWHQVGQFFKNHRRVKWVTVFLPKNSSVKKRKEFRVRQIIGYLRSVGKAQLICSEFKKKCPSGRRKYLACNDMKATPRQILWGYRIRWEIEIFHKMIKMFLGFEDVAAKSFNSIASHVHWVYCAYILMNSHPPGMPRHTKSMAEKQKMVTQSVRKKEMLSVLQLLSQINGVDRYKIQLRQALESPLACQNAF